MEGDTTWTPTYQQKYISELVFVGGSGTSQISVGILTSADGSTDNANIYARQTPDPARSLQGFGGYTKYLNSSLIRTAPTVATDSVSMPGFASVGNLYSFGSSEYSSDPNFTSLPNIKSSVSSLLGGRHSSDQWIGIRIQDFTNVTTDDRERVFQSSKNASYTVGLLKGAVLTIDYTPPSALFAVHKTSPGLDASDSKYSATIRSKVQTGRVLVGQLKTRKDA